MCIRQIRHFKVCLTLGDSPYIFTLLDVCGDRGLVMGPKKTCSEIKIILVHLFRTDCVFCSVLSIFPTGRLWLKLQFPVLFA